MPLDRETVRNIAFLARVRVEDAELDALVADLSGILTWVEQLNEVDTAGVEPMTSVAELTLPMRKDVVTDGNCPERVLANAPEREGDFYAVPKVVE